MNGMTRPGRQAALAGLLTTLAAGAYADDVDCPPNLGAVTIDGNVLIAAACEMDGTTVKGNVLLYAGGSLVARDIHVDGNVQADNAFDVDIVDSDIDGSVQLDELVGDGSRVSGTEIDGNIQLKDNRNPLSIVDNDVDGDVQAFGNSGGVDISENDIDGNLQCKDNDPAPTGGDNDVDGDKEDQCSDLQPGPNTPASVTPDTSPPASSTAGVGAAEAATNGGGSLGPLETLLLCSAFMACRGRRRRV